LQQAVDLAPAQRRGGGLAWVRDAFTSTKTISFAVFHDEVDFADPAAPPPVAQAMPRPKIGAFHLTFRRRAETVIRLAAALTGDRRDPLAEPETNSSRLSIIPSSSFSFFNRSAIWYTSRRGRPVRSATSPRPP
jgi:hypothetical protein